MKAPGAFEDESPYASLSRRLEGDYCYPVRPWAFEEGMKVDEWWAEVADVTLGGERQFPILSRFTILTLTQPLSPYQVCPEPLYFSRLQP